MKTSAFSTLLHDLVVVLGLGAFATAIARVERVRVPAAAVDEDCEDEVVRMQRIGEVVEELHVRRGLRE